ncbi:MAG: hypothetical protein HY704_07510 [Gemmatimonadetes bacterium]|nr:hypothetical protein [Gemmatimonadota bacterium]
MKTFQVTVRYGRERLGYHTFTVDAEEAATALRAAAAEIPAEIVEAVDLVEVRVAVSPQARRYAGEGA